MKAVLQRVKRASVRVGSETIAQIGPGILVLLGVGAGDGRKDIEYLAEKISGIRIFEDEQGKMNLSVADIGGEMMVVSQFTLYADCRKGKRPSFTEAAPPGEAERLYLEFARLLREKGLKVAEGRFQARMEVDLVNDGPVTIILDTKS
ncbi:MAG: D-aminoacyl-tRNA deacylase [Proteobacteria bacterium]|nr:D-aminoacyl-tRNA deacylase [Pseudomonadota bacterium]